MGFWRSIWKSIVAYNAVLVALLAVALVAPPNLLLIPAFDAINELLNWCDNSAINMANNKFYHGIFTALRTEGTHRRPIATGTLPLDLDGIFLRNGPNPQHPPVGVPIASLSSLHAIEYSPIKKA